MYIYCVCVSPEVSLLKKRKNTHHYIRHNKLYDISDNLQSTCPTPLIFSATQRSVPKRIEDIKKDLSNSEPNTSYSGIVENRFVGIGADRVSFESEVLSGSVPSGAVGEGDDEPRNEKELSPMPREVRDEEVGGKEILSWMMVESK